MTEYIDREKLIKSIKNDCLEQVFYTKEDAISCVEAAPIEEVEKVIHGNWVIKRNNAICSVCGAVYEGYYDKYKRCPLCGAKMDLG